MKILAIESSCDETAAAVVEDGRKVLSSSINSQIAEHRKFGGVVPEIASRRHTENICDVTRDAMEQAGVTADDIDAIAVTAAPGLIGALLVGVNFAKGLALAWNKPLVAVHHIRGHIAANYLAHPDLKPPFFCLVVSGGHTHMVEVRDYTDFHIVGRTRDDAVGEAFDKAARCLGFSYPGGVQMDKEGQNGDPHAYKLPVPKVEGSPYDFSFSGLKTAVINTVHNAQQKGEPVVAADMAASFGYTVSELLTTRFCAAAEEFGHHTLALAGGVAANSTLRSRLQQECDAKGLKLYVPPLSLCGDNAAMIAAQGYYEYMAGYRADQSLNGRPAMEIDIQF